MHKPVVLDSNVVVSSIFWEKGNPHKVVDLAIGQKIHNFTSPAMLFELVKVLKDDFKQPEEFVQRQIALVANYSDIIRPKLKIQEVKDDPKDDMVLECALSGKANYIVTGDNHLLKMKEFMKIKILSPKDFLELAI
ncbi:putative toxin-antitoxin system toxin component, PIN family [Candidatus Woesearchaeota archaeon]|nr:putative toxin-antitoxin system toxin component, PIN family [Candidatus Woesearchaeota archaeon]